MNTVTNEDFYNECANILNTTHNGSKFPYYYRTRWNNRKEGRGRFEGCGIIRCFGDTVHIALTSPSCICICQSKNEALELLSTL